MESCPRKLPRLLAASWAFFMAFFMACFVGCGGSKKPARIVASELPVQILVIDDAPIAAAIEKTWKEQAEGEIKVFQKTSREIIESPRRVLDADVVVYPAWLIGELSDRDMLAPLSSEVRRDEALRVRDFLPAIRLQTATWGREMVASCFGAPQLLLLYRPDVLEALGTEPPTTWDEYRALAEKMADADSLTDLSVEKAKWLGAVEPSDLSSAMLLARAACHYGAFNEASALWDYRKMEPKIAEPPFIRALELMRGDAVNRTLATPLECYHALVRGDCGMAICWPTAFGIAKAGMPDPPLPIRCLPLPGAKRTYELNQWEDQEEVKRMPLVAFEGRLISVTREAQRRDAAAQRLVVLSGRDHGDSIGLASHATMPSRKGTRDLSRWTGGAIGADGLRDLAEIWEAAAAGGKSMTMLRIPGRAKYLKALETAIEADTPPQAALDEAAKQWQQITNEIGIDRQRDALSESLAL